jgi:hypothetical protein
MLLLVVILKAAVELSLMVIVGRAVLGVLAGQRRHGNVFWQMLDIAARPALWTTRKASPKQVLDRHIPLAAFTWLAFAWVLLAALKIDRCLALGTAACR